MWTTTSHSIECLFYITSARVCTLKHTEIFHRPQLSEPSSWMCVFGCLNPCVAGVAAHWSCCLAAERPHRVTETDSNSSEATILKPDVYSVFPFCCFWTRLGAALNIIIEMFSTRQWERSRSCWTTSGSLCVAECDSKTPTETLIESNVRTPTCLVAL